MLRKNKIMMRWSLLAWVLTLLLTASMLTGKTTDTLFMKGSYDITTMMYMPQVHQHKGLMTCAIACLKNSNCKGFKQQDALCNFTNYMPAKAIQSSVNRVDLWLSSKATPAHHFLLIDAGSTGNGKIYDFSSSEQVSLPAKFSATWPRPSKGGPYMLSSNGMLRAWPVFIGSKNSVEWNIGEPNMQQRSSDISSIAFRDVTGWTSMDEAMFIIGAGSTVTEAWGYVEGKWKQLRSFGKAIKNTCAAFIPGTDKDSVYFMGGIGDSSLYKYSFKQNAYSTLHLDESFKLNYLSCTGYRDAGGNQYYVQVGGAHEGLGPLNVVRMFCINCESPGWTSLPEYPLTIYSSAVVEKDGILYSFGGITGVGAEVLKVYTLDLRSPLQWTHFRDLEAVVRRANVYLIPYD